MSNYSAQKPAPFIGLFTLTMLSVSAIIALRNLPTMAFHGLSALFFYSCAAALFFIPISLVVAELSAAWPKRGGVYAWVTEAFGNKTGALAIWLEWIESVVWLPTVLSFIAATLAYIIDPTLAENRYFLLAAMLFFMWGGTFLNFLGMKTSSWVSSVGIIMGSLIPGVVIIGLGVLWIIKGHPSHIDISTKALLPAFNLNTLIFFTGVILGFAGIEVAAYHIQETKNPKRNYPLATFLTAFIIIFIYLFGSLAIAIIVPKAELSLTSGLMQAYSGFFRALEMEWAIKIIGIMGLLGAIALLNTWIIGPSKGLLVSSENGDFPPFTQKINQRGMPVNILLSQGALTTLLTLLFLFMPTINASYWVLNVMAGQLISLMYFFVFLAFLRLRYTQPNTPRGYVVPGGKYGAWLVGITGALACLLAFFIGFLAPNEINFGNTRYYSLSLIIGIIILSSPPLLYQAYKSYKVKLNIQGPSC